MCVCVCRCFVTCTALKEGEAQPVLRRCSIRHLLTLVPVAAVVLVEVLVVVVLVEVVVVVVVVVVG